MKVLVNMVVISKIVKLLVMKILIKWIIFLNYVKIISTTKTNICFLNQKIMKNWVIVNIIFSLKDFDIKKLDETSHIKKIRVLS